MCNADIFMASLYYDYFAPSLSQFPRMNETFYTLGSINLEPKYCYKVYVNFFLFFFSGIFLYIDDITHKNVISSIPYVKANSKPFTWYVERIRSSGIEIYVEMLSCRPANPFPANEGNTMYVYPSYTYILIV